MDEFKIESLLDEDLVFLGMEAEDWVDVLRKLSAAAGEKGYVKDTYFDAVLERERLYPTALPTPVMKVAVPHAMERSHVVRPVIVVATLKKPIAFKEMGEGISDVPVDAVFMLAVNGDKEQLTVLQKLVSMFSDCQAMQRLKDAADPAGMVAAVKENLAG